MHIRTILAIARKDALDVLLNKSTLTLLIMPIILSVLFVVVTDIFGSHKTEILVYNPGNSAVVQVVSGAFSDPQIVSASSPADVASAFGPDGSHKSSPYAVGLVIPANFDAALRQGGHPQMSLYINGDDVNIQQRQLLQSAIMNYSRVVANPSPPASINMATINPPAPTTIGQDLGTLYITTALLVSFMVSTSLVGSLLVEEKEKKTLRMLMVSPASFGDVVLGKLLVGLGYQLLLSLVVMVIEGGFVGQVPLVLFFVLCGACFSLSLGLLLGSIFQSSSAVGGVAGMVSIIYIIPGIFVGPLLQVSQGNVAVQLIKILPSYYMADGIYSALVNKAVVSNALLDALVILACTVILLLASVWTLRRQASVVAAI